MSALLEFERSLAASWPPEAWRDVTVLIAVSGGADSVALLRGLNELKSPGARLVVGHFNHRLRADESDRDEQFVVDLAGKLGLPIEVQRAADQPRSSTPFAPHVSAGVARVRIEAWLRGWPVSEEASRDARYAFFLDAAHRTGARYVALAHTADDQAETILHRIVRGTGLAGLAGMPRVRLLSPAVSLIRPMLHATRAEVLEYLADLGQAHREDSTNLDRGYTRNQIRLDVLPRLAEDHNLNVRQALLRLARQAGEAQAAIDVWANSELEGRLRRQNAETLAIDLKGLHDVPRHVVRSMFALLWREQRWPEQAMGFDEFDSLASMACNPEASGTTTLPGNVSVRRVESQLLLTPPL
jgi:tRNA(Ile)-lysidine synthase